jgi:dihydropteroate synthase-like protein
VKDVVKSIKEEDIEFDVFRSSAQVACLSSVDSIVNELIRSHVPVKKYDLIILPGLIRGSARLLEKAFGVKAVKGTTYAGDLPEMIRYLKEGITFSPEVPADSLIQVSIEEDIRKRIKEAIASNAPLFTLNNVGFTITPPPMVLLFEYMKGRGDPASVADYIVKYGYEGVILGCDVDCDPSQDLWEVLDLFKDRNLIVGLDVLDYARVGRKSLADFDLLANINGETLKAISDSITSRQALIIIPDDTSSPEALVGSLKENVERALELGLNKIIVDPLIRPPMLGFSQSLMAHSRSMEELPYPRLFGLPNFYELIDADSPGVVASLTSLAFELGASVLLVTESSNKVRGVAKEVSVAREMVYRAYVRKSPPINVGLDLLILKEKRAKELKPPEIKEGIEYETVTSHIPPSLDPTVYLKIFVDRVRNEVIVDAYRREDGALLARFSGHDVLSLGRHVVQKLGLGSQHALYLGYELSKAQIALQLCKSYEQDSPLFKFKCDSPS